MTKSTSFISSSLTENTDRQNEFQFFVEQFADLKILRYQVPEFEGLSLQQKKLVYYLSQATLAGRDIIYDQNGKYNLLIRKTLEAIFESFSGDRSSSYFKSFVVYLKRVWFSNGIYHHYASDKFLPEFPVSYFSELVENCNQSLLPLQESENPEQLVKKLIPVMFDPQVLPKKVNQDSSVDMVKHSAVNFYENISQKEVEDYYATLQQKDDPRPLSYGLNSKLVKENNRIIEKIYCEKGLYGAAIGKIISWLEKAAEVAENKNQKTLLLKLIEYYKTGDLKTWDDFNVLWVKDLESQVDFVNGFIENYEDPLGLKATWEGIVNFKNLEATIRTQIISDNAQWFEDHSPVDPRFKKKTVKGVSAKVITMAQMGGDNYPSTAIGINLPNADWIRKEHGSKSVTIDNITYAYDQAAKGNGFLEEFTHSPEEIKLIHAYGYLTDSLHTDLHECLGHGSGQLLPGTATDALKNYQSALEEARADLYALYFLMDPKLVELKLLPDSHAAQAEYIKYIKNGLMTQLTRIPLGKDIEESHMRNRQLIAKWCLEKGGKDKVIEKLSMEGKTYFRINDFEKLRLLFGALLAEVQRIKSEGDYEAGKILVESYGVKVDRNLHEEVLERFKKLNLAPYAGFLNPVYSLVVEDKEITDVSITYPTDYTEQMMYYSKNYSFL